MIEKALKDRVKRHEGLRLKPYECPKGKLTIGYGHNIEDNGIPRIVAEDLLDIDLLHAQNELFSNYPAYRWLSSGRKNALIDMAFNMGLPGLKNFKKMHKALSESDFDSAANEVLDSDYARQLPKRSLENSELIRNGE